MVDELYRGPERTASGLGLWLTAEDARAFRAELYATVKKYRGNRNADHHPEETRRLLYLTAFVPTV